ncbi:MAG: 50S ribosomal protein L30 [Vampirovibrionales bacterium]
MTASDKKLKITLTRSVLGTPEKQRRVVAALGLKKTNRSVEHYDTVLIRGMIRKVSHLLTVEEC